MLQAPVDTNSQITVYGLESGILSHIEFHAWLNVYVHTQMFYIAW